MALNYSTTWMGLLGGGVSGSVLAGGSIYQIDVWNLGGKPLPARVLVKGTRLGVMAEAGTAHTILIVTGCSQAREMDGILSSGLDWELAVGLKGSALAKVGSNLLKAVAAQAMTKGFNWAVHESAKRFVQWAMDDLGVIKPGKQFNLLPSPLSFAVGAGIFYEWQKLHLLSGRIGWQYITPKWYLETIRGDVWLQLYNIPEQDGENIKIGFSVPKWGLDPYILWKKKSKSHYSGNGRLHINGYAYGGYLFERRDGMGYSGINLSKFIPTGRSEQGILSNTHTDEVKRSGSLEVRLTVFKFGNVPYWEAKKTFEMILDSDGSFISFRL